MLTTAAILHPTQGVGGLLASAHSLSDAVADWWRGVDLGGSQCGAPEVIGPCPTSPGELPDRPPTPSRWAPSIIRQSVECSTLSGDMSDYASTALTLTREWAVARTLQFGGDGNPSLSGDATPLGSAATLRDAIAVLEGDAADELTGRRAYLHVPATPGPRCTPPGRCGRRSVSGPRSTSCAATTTRQKRGWMRSAWPSSTRVT